MPRRTDIHKVLVIGSGPLILGQACESDYSGAQACKALRKLGYEIVLVNSDPATITTDPGVADATYIEPLNVASIEKIIVLECPDALLPNCGGQTGLNLSLQLSRSGVLDKYGVRMIGIDADAIDKGENRESFKQTMSALGIATPRGEIALGLEEAESILERIDLPCAIRPAYTVGGTGGGLVYNLEEFRAVVSRGLASSLIGQVLVEESIEGWEELELVVIRDSKAQKITVCFIENMDAMGIHSGDSFCCTPMLAVEPELAKRLEKYAHTILDAIGIVGGAGIKFAHNPSDGRVVAIEINPRTSRSSTLASKATGLPVAFVSSLLAGGMTLDEIPYQKEGMLEKFTQRGDHVAVKSSRWEFEKFKGAEDRLGSQMHAIGEIMSIGKNFKEAFQKSIRSLEIGRLGLGFAKDFNEKPLTELMGMLWRPTSERVFIMYEALRKGATIDELYEKTRIKPWFIRQMKELVDLEEKIVTCKGDMPQDALLLEAKRNGFADGYLGKLTGIPEERIRSRRNELEIKEAWHAIPVSGAEKGFFCYSTYNATDMVQTSDHKKVMVLGSGPNRIGQGIEFDYCCVHSVFALRDLGYETIMVNCNPETVSTDYDTSDKLYLEPVTVEDVMSIYEKENPEGVIVQFGGQTPPNISRDLEEAGARILGTSPDTIDLAKDNDRFRSLMQKLGIPQPDSGTARSLKEAIATADRIGYPLMMRPFRVSGGRGMEIVHDREDLALYMDRAMEAWPDLPILIDKFLENALEVEADAVSDGSDAFVPAIMEHIELAGVHSGDSACVLPAVTIDERHRDTIEKYTKKIAAELKVIGMINVRYAITGDTVYVLEASPQASRTVPVVSKVCNTPMVRIAVQLMMGKNLVEMNLNRKKIDHFGVKEAVFPFNMFPEVDPVLGPEMRSTGEVLGLADSFELAFYKSQEAAQQRLPKEGTVLISVTDPDKREALKAAQDFAGMGFHILATEGTRKFLTDNGVQCTGILKISEGRPNIVDAIKNGEIHLVVNSPNGKRGISDDSYIRKAAVEYKVAYITTMAAAKAAAKGIGAFRKRDPRVVPLHQYYS